VVGSRTRSSSARSNASNVCRSSKKSRPTSPCRAPPTHLVDVEFEVKEGPSAQLGGGIGYSSRSRSCSTAAASTVTSWLRRAHLVDLNTGRYQKIYGLSHTNPYTNIDGVARTLSFTYRKQTQFVSASSDFSSESLALGVDYGYPITEFQGLSSGFPHSVRL
jgi:outer membrane protein insertion porin family